MNIQQLTRQQQYFVWFFPLLINSFYFSLCSPVLCSSSHRTGASKIVEFAKMKATIFIFRLVKKSNKEEKNINKQQTAQIMSSLSWTWCDVDDGYRSHMRCEVRMKNGTKPFYNEYNNQSDNIFSPKNVSSIFAHKIKGFNRVSVQMERQIHVKHVSFNLMSLSNCFIFLMIKNNSYTVLIVLNSSPKKICREINEWSRWM